MQRLQFTEYRKHGETCQLKISHHAAQYNFPHVMACFEWRNPWDFEATYPLFLYTDEKWVLCRVHGQSDYVDPGHPIHFSLIYDQVNVQDTWYDEYHPSLDSNEPTGEVTGMHYYPWTEVISYSNKEMTSMTQINFSNVTCSGGGSCFKHKYWSAANDHYVCSYYESRSTIFVLSFIFFRG